MKIEMNTALRDNIFVFDERGFECHLPTLEFYILLQFPTKYYLNKKPSSYFSI